MELEMTLREIRNEIAEKSKDLDVFVRARSLIRARVLEITDSESRLTPLPMWSGTDAVLGSLDLSIHAMERTIAELREHEKVMSLKHNLRLVRDEEKN